MRLVCVFDVFGSELLFLPAVADGFDARAAASLRRFDYFDLPRLVLTCWHRAAASSPGSCG